MSKRNRTNSQANIGQIIQQGVGQLQAGNLQEAERSFKTALRADPKNPDALNFLATVANKSGQPAEAIKLMQKAVAVVPGNAKLRNNLAYSYLFSAMPDKALEQLEKSIIINPKDFETLQIMGIAYVDLENSEKAIEAYNSALEINPDSIAAIAGLADVYANKGDKEKAVELFSSALQKDPNNVQAFVGLADAGNLEPDSKEVSHFNELLKSPQIPPMIQNSLNNAMGKIHHGDKQYDVAFSYFSNKAHESAGHFNIEDFRRFIDANINAFSTEFFKERKEFGDDSERPVFIIGMPRSGTSLCDQILSSHPEMESAGELSKITNIRDELGKGMNNNENSVLARISRLNKKDFLRLANEYKVAINHYSKTSQRLVDKMPHNFISLSLIVVMFPKAKIIHCQRDAMDTCFSFFSQRYTSKHSYANNLTDLGLYYREYVRLMEHWKQVLPINIHELQYENVVANQEAESRKLVKFTGLEWDDACLNFHETDRAMNTPSRWQVSQPIYTSSLKRWKRYDKHLAPLKEALGDLYID